MQGTLYALKSCIKLRHATFTLCHIYFPYLSKIAACRQKHSFTSRVCSAQYRCIMEARMDVMMKLLNRDAPYEYVSH